MRFKRMKMWPVLFCSIPLLSGCQLITDSGADKSSATVNEVVVTTQLSGVEAPPEESVLASNTSPEQAVIATITADTQITVPDTPVTIAPVEEADVWQRIRRQLVLEAPEDPRLIAQRNWYLRNPNYMDRVATRAEPFMYLIVEEIERRQLPLELALLPIVESAFDPFAYSHGRASGIWQFIPGTARHYGLDINWWYDGRRDVKAATMAALDYLEYLHRFFDGDWLHALAAYNSGEGRVRNAIRKNARAGKATDFWSLDLPRETRAYVPKLLALADILKRQQEYEFTFKAIANQPFLAVVEAPAQIDLAKAAEQAEMPLDTLHHYNSAYNRWATNPDGPHRLLLPLANAEKLQTWLASSDAKDWVQWTRHKVKRGESLLVIARHYHTTADAIQTANNIDSHIIRAGDYLLIPVATRDLDEYNLSADQRLADTQNTQRGQYKVEHRVVAGDTLWDISRKYDVNLRALARWNGMAPTDPLRPGKELVIWVEGEERRSASVIRSLSYQVRSGDSLARIANRFKVTIADIEKWNQISRSNYLQPGQQLKLFVDVTQ